MAHADIQRVPGVCPDFKMRQGISAGVFGCDGKRGKTPLHDGFPVPAENIAKIKIGKVKEAAQIFHFQFSGFITDREGLENLFVFFHSRVRFAVR